MRSANSVLGPMATFHPVSALLRETLKFNIPPLLRLSDPFDVAAWSADDARQARFSIAPKQTNERWAIDLVSQVPAKSVTTRVVSCDGGPGGLGHPRIYINLDES
ncbi:unnamed protein product, partial [Meganyctiphanes norvegica]